MQYLNLKIFYLLLILNSLVFAEDNWKLEKNKNGIKVWTQKPENSTLKEFKSNVVVDAGIEKVVAYFKNYKQYDNWMYRLEKGTTKELKKLSDNEFYILTVMSAPFIKNRDIVTKYCILPADEKGVILLKVDNACDFIPEDEKCVRIKKINAIWKFTPIAKNKTEIYHQALTDPGGSIPKAFVNMAIADAPFTMLSKLKELFK
jgi:hypothetical protein